MPDCQPADVFFTLLIGTFCLTLLLLTLREDAMRARGK